MTDRADGMAGRAPAPGSRARTRELGYAAACMDLSWMLRDVARSWHAGEFYAAERGQLDDARLIGAAVTAMEERSQLAGAMWELYADDRPPADPKSIIGWAWKRTPPPHETGSFPAVP